MRVIILSSVKRRALRRPRVWRDSAGSDVPGAISGNVYDFTRTDIVRDMVQAYAVPR
jgi:hypothetical protein